MKSKYSQLLEKKKELIAESNKNSDGAYKQFLSYFQPKKEFEKGHDRLQIRILPPAVSGMSFFEEYKKHYYITENKQFKSTICLDTVMSDGSQFVGNCPLCKFLHDNKTEISDDTRRVLYPTNSYMMLVYNKYSDEVQKYEVNDIGLVDIIGALETLGDDFDPDINGFDVYFERNNKGYGKVVSASKPVETVEQIMENSKNFKERKNVIDETYINKNYAKKNALAILTFIVEEHEPGFCDSLSNYAVPDDETAFEFGKNTKNNTPTNENVKEEIVSSSMGDSGIEDNTLDELRQLMNDN